MQKKDFLDGSFLGKLRSSKQKILMNDKEYINAELLFEEQGGRCIGIANAYVFYEEPQSESRRISLNQLILNKMKELKLSHFFMIRGLSH